MLRVTFNQIKQVCNQHLPISPINYNKLQNPDIPYNLYLVTDASKIGVGSFLCHGKTFEEAKKNVAVIHSRKSTPAQCNYSTTDQEFLGIIDALRTFEDKLLGVKFTIVTDHMALRTLMHKQSEINGELDGWKPLQCLILSYNIYRAPKIFS